MCNACTVGTCTVHGPGARRGHLWYTTPESSGRPCRRGPRSWWCSRGESHGGPCAMRPRWWNVRDRWQFRRLLS